MSYRQALAVAGQAIAARKAVTPQQKAVQVAAAAGERVIAVRQRAADAAIGRIAALWAAVNPYDRRQVDEFAAAAAKILAAAQVATGRAAAASIVTQLKAMGVTVAAAPILPVDVRGQTVTVGTRGAVTVVRDTVTVDYDGGSVQVAPGDMTTEAVMRRPAAVYRRAVADESGDASAASLLRIGRLVDEQLMLTQRLAETAVMTRAVSLDAKGPKVLGYRRLIHPEMSRGGTCGLCIAAADRIYHAKTLRPIHALCKCTVSPVTADHDPADALNQADLSRLYKDAGGTSASALKRTRYTVDEHGELGAVLVPKKPYTPRDKAKRADAARNARAVAAKPETKAEIAARHLPHMEKNLADMRARGVAEDDPKIVWHKKRITEMQADADRPVTRASGASASRISVEQGKAPKTASGTDSPGGPPRPPRNIPPMMGSPEDRYPDMQNGDPAPLRPSDIRAIGEADLQHILERHGYKSGMPRTREFPERWGKAVEGPIEAGLWDPATQRTIWPDRSADTVFIRALYDQVVLRIVLTRVSERSGWWDVITAHPISGTGVFYNHPDRGRIEYPLNLDDLTRTIE